MEDKEYSIGAFWRKEGKSGVKYWSGVLELPGMDKIEVVAFANTRKQEGEKTPDIRMYRSKPLKGHLEGEAKQEAPDPEAADVPF